MGFCSGNHRETEIRSMTLMASKSDRFMVVLKMIKFAPGNRFRGTHTHTKVKNWEETAKRSKTEEKFPFSATSSKNGIAPTGRH